MAGVGWGGGCFFCAVTGGRWCARLLFQPCSLLCSALKGKSRATVLHAGGHCRSLAFGLMITACCRGPNLQPPLSTCSAPPGCKSSAGWPAADAAKPQGCNCAHGSSWSPPPPAHTSPGLLIAPAQLQLKVKNANPWVSGGSVVWSQKCPCKIGGASWAGHAAYPTSCSLVLAPQVTSSPHQFQFMAAAVCADTEAAVLMESSQGRCSGAADRAEGLDYTRSPARGTRASHKTPLDPSKSPSASFPQWPTSLFWVKV